MSDPRDPNGIGEPVSEPVTEPTPEPTPGPEQTTEPTPEQHGEQDPPPPASVPPLPPYATAPYPAGAFPGAIPGSGYPGAAPGYPGAAPGYPGAAPGATPGYPGATPTEAAPVGAPLVQPYPGAPPAAAYGGGYLPPPVAGAAPPPGSRPKTLAIIGLVLSLIGLVMAFVPFVTWFSGFVLLAGFVVALIALINKTQGAKGLSIAALVISVVGWIVSVVVSIASFAILADATTEAIDPGPGIAVTEPPVDDDPAGDPATAAEELVIVESAFGRTSYDPETWWYAVVIENPNADYVFDTYLDIEALAADGTALESVSEYPTILSGQAAVAGLFTAIGAGEITELGVAGLDEAEVYEAPFDETGSFVVSDLASASDGSSTTVTGTVSGDFESDMEFVSVVVLVRSAGGAIIEAEYTYVDLLPSDGTPVPFEATFFEEFPEGTTFEAFPSL